MKFAIFFFLIIIHQSKIWKSQLSLFCNKMLTYISGPDQSKTSSYYDTHYAAIIFFTQSVSDLIVSNIHNQVIVTQSFNFIHSSLVHTKKCFEYRLEGSYDKICS